MRSQVWTGPLLNVVIATAAIGCVIGAACTTPAGGEGTTGQQNPNTPAEAATPVENTGPKGP